MIKCFKGVAKAHNLSIITSIHQPNLEILMLFDILYVLAKGGTTVYSGRPEHLRRHMSDCDISIRENQIPIEVLMVLGANGSDDQKNIEMSDKTSEDLRRFDKRLLNETKLYSNGIPLKSKAFSWPQVWYLLMRDRKSVV